MHPHPDLLVIMMVCIWFWGFVNICLVKIMILLETKLQMHPFNC